MFAFEICMTMIAHPGFDTLIHRARAEFREMPGLQLTFGQMRRLWALDRPTCEALVDRLVEDRVLTRTPSGHFVRFGSRERPIAAVARKLRSL